MDLEKPKATVLVVDDEVAYCDAAADVLEAHGYRVVKANDARQAKAVLEVEKPDAILLDIMMPEIDGLTLLGELASMPRFLGVPLVIVSAKVMPADIGNAWVTGADAYLCKPYTADELVGIVQHVLRPQDETFRRGGTDRLRNFL
jgi:CheY-like chemotaxis protein